jgi:hypothetical protein
MLAVFNVIHKAHCRLSHLAVDQTLAATKPAFYSPTYELCKIYCKNCYMCMEKQPTVLPRIGAKKPIIFSEFCDRFQVDLIDMRTMRKKDVCGVMQRWIMTVKDHSTSLVYFTALPRKTAMFIAAKFEKYFGFVVYPHIFHTGMQNLELKNYLDFVCYNFLRFVINCNICFDTDDGMEFIAHLVVDLMKQNDPNCFIVTGRPRTPCDQGSVESANKLVQCVMKSISSERHLAGLKVNWTRFLGQVMALCNSHSIQKKYCISNYEAVFGQKYHPTLKCSLEEMHECRSIFQRLRLSPDERLEKYVQENDIVDIEFDKIGLAAAFDEDDEDEEEHE